MIDSIRNPHGESLDFSLFRAARPDAPFVVIGHGVTANKDRPWAQTLGAALQDAQISHLRLSFSGNGDSEGSFAESTISKEVDDLGAVLDHLAGAGVDRVCYVGHSMGAAVGVLRAVQDPRITRLVSLGGMVHTADFANRKFGDLRPDVDVMWDRADCPLSSTFLRDLAEIVSVVEHGTRVTVPWLLVHGRDDSVVPPSESRAIAARAPRATVIELADVDHVFSGDGANQMATRVVAWLQDTAGSA